MTLKVCVGLGASQFPIFQIEFHKHKKLPKFQLLQHSLQVAGHNIHHFPLASMTFQAGIIPDCVRLAPDQGQLLPDKMA